MINKFLTRDILLHPIILIKPNKFLTRHTTLFLTRDTTLHCPLNACPVNVDNRSTGRIMPLGLRYDSFLPTSYKNNLIQCLLHRAYKISSTFNLFDQDVQKLRQFFFWLTFTLSLFFLYLSQEIFR